MNEKDGSSEFAPRPPVTDTGRGRCIHNVPCCGECEINHVLAHVADLERARKEEREAAFREAATILNEFGRELRKVDFLARLEAAVKTHKQIELDRVLAEAEIEDPIGVRLTELELERMDRVEAAASTKEKNDT